MLNKVALMGRLVKDPELRRTQAGIAVTSMRLACQRDFVTNGGERASDFFDVTCWRMTAEFAERNFRKGQLIAVAGRLQQREWTDKDGNKRNSVEIVADEVHFAEARRDDSGGYSTPPRAPESQYSAPGHDAAPVSQISAPSSFAELDDNEEELPF